MVTTVGLIIVFLLWRLHGGLMLACAMWMLAFAYLRTLPPRLKGLIVPWLSVLLGMVCNALVIISNGGFMPVVGLRPGFKPLLPCWISQVSVREAHLRLLADQRSLQYCSIGDVFLISGVLLWCIGPTLLTHVRKLAVVDPKSTLC
jgi:hypothetical protein